MRVKIFVYCLLLIFAFSKSYSQNVKGRFLEVTTVDREVHAVDMYDQACLHVVDGLVSSYNDYVPQELLAHFEQVGSKEKLERLGFSGNKCVMVKSTVDLELENYIYRQVHGQVQRVGTQYKLPIAINGKLTHSYKERRSQMSSIKEEEIKEIKFLDKAAAQEKYGSKVVFGLIEITI